MDHEFLQGEVPPPQEAEGYRQVQHALLELFAQKSSRADYLDEVVKLLMRCSGCRCGGVRVLDEYGNIPYESYQGFSREFWESESHLSIHRDQCACIRVISQKPESQDFRVMTPLGSFYCNNTFQFMENLSEGERARFRGTCIQSGFASVAVIPIRYRDEVLGAIHLADEEEEKVPRHLVEFIESLTPFMGSAIHRFNLEEEIQRDHETQRVINSLMSLSLEEIPLEELLRRGLELILSIPWLSLESRAAVFLMEGDAGPLALKAQIGLPESVRQACARVPLGYCICGQAAQKHDIHFVPYPAPEHDRISPDLPSHGHYCVPLVSSEGVLGVTNLYLPESYRDDERKREFLRTIAKVFVSTIKHKRAEEAIRESEKQLRSLSLQLLNAQEKERKRIAQELHDGIGQIMAAIKFGMENILSPGSQRKDPSVTKTRDTTIQLIRKAIEEVRRISTDLRPAILDDLGILATLGWFIREFESIYSDIRIERRLTIREEEIPDPLKIVIYRLFQEAMNNVAKHSQARHVSVSLAKKGNLMELAIADKGIGFDLEIPRAGIGLVSMRERVELSGGKFTLQSTKGKGTVIWATWPV